MKNHFYKMVSVIVSNKHNQNPISTQDTERPKEYSISKLNQK